MYKTKDMKVTFLGVIPVLKDETGVLDSQTIVSLSALLTFKGKSVKELYNQTIEKGQDIGEKVKTIIRKSSLRGHASIATTPTLCFTYEASKFLDSLMTGTIFSSSLMASGRRTDTTIEDIVFPSSILENLKAKELYEEESKKNIELLNYFLEKGIEKDEASKILQYGIYGTGIITWPIESVIGFKKELEAEGEWVPEEAQLFIEEVERHTKEFGIDLLYASRELAPRDVYPIPSIFKNPKISNITRELINKKGLSDDLTEIVDFHTLITSGLEEKAKAIVKEEGKIKNSPEKVKSEWRKLLQLRRELNRDYNQSLSVKILSSVSWRVWSEKKRHRTVPHTPESIYHSLEIALPVFEKYKDKILSKKLEKEEIKEINRVFSISRVFAENDEYLYRYLERALGSVLAYFELINSHKVKPRDAIFLIPRGIRLSVLQEYNLYNLISGYFPLRSCSTVEPQLREFTLKEIGKIKKKMEESGLPNVAKLIVPKCHISHFCLEEKSCPTIKSLLPFYNDEFHEEVKANLDKEFEESLETNIAKQK